MAGAEPPYVEIGDPVAPRLEPLPDQLGAGAARHRIEQHCGRRPDEAVGPDGDDDHAEQPGDRIEPVQVEIGGGAQRRDRKHRGEGVGEHVNIGGAEIVVRVVRMIIVSGMVVIMIMVVVVVSPCPCPCP